MTSPFTVTLVYEPSTGDRTPLTSGAERFDRLRSELSHHAGADVRLVEGPFPDVVPAEGFVLLAARDHPGLTLQRCSDEQLAEVARRTLPVGVSRKGLLDMLERFALAGAIESFALAEWEGTEPDAIGAWGLYGHKELAGSIGATCQELYASARYCYLGSETHVGLAHLLADYLRTLAPAEFEGRPERSR